jgi:hypothetical protein
LSGGAATAMSRMMLAMFDSQFVLSSKDTQRRRGRN